MAHSRSDRPFASIHNILKMLLSPHSSNKPTQQDTEVPEDVDEPPDPRFLRSSRSNTDNGLVYVKAPAVMNDQKESLLTRALKNSPELSPAKSPSRDHTFSYRSYPYSNVSGISTAELTSDGGMTSPSLSNSPSPPVSSQLMSRPSPMTVKPEAGESTVEANLGRKRCISFACGRKADDKKEVETTPKQPTTKNANPEPTSCEPFKRKTVLTFVCPARDPETRRERSPGRKPALRSRLRGSPAPVARKASPEKVAPSPLSIPKEVVPSTSERRGVPTSGLGKFEDSEATRFHEFASSVEEDEWVSKVGEYTQKITMNDCMKKEHAIRKLGQEAEEEEALEDEMDDDDDDDDDEAIDDDDDSTVSDSSDDGNESDNEAGFADSDESDGGSDYEFWAPSTTTAATSPQTIDVTRHTLDRRLSNTSFDSANEGHRQQMPPAICWQGTGRRSSKACKIRPGTPNLPDSTDFVCGTLDEDRPLEAAYKSCIEQRRMSKQIVIPQDIDPSFPTSDPEDNGDEEDDDEEEESVPLPHFAQVKEELTRGRPGVQARKPSPHPSPKRMHSPPPRRQGRSSPKRLRSPPPPMKLRSAATPNRAATDEGPIRPQGLNISELVQRPPMVRTKSLPRTPNPFFTGLDKSHQWSGIAPLSESPEREHSRTREVHTRGPIDIVEGLEKKRQKRKEKFWRQHCRKAAKEQAERRPIPGKGAERMKELGLEVAERCRAYGVGEDTQLVLSV